MNPDLIQRIDSAPDTIISLIDGTKYIVTESMAEAIDLINEYRAQVLARAQQIQTGPRMELVPALPDDRDTDPPGPAGGDAPPPVPLRPRSR